MLSNVKTRIYKYADLSREALTQIKRWLRPGADVSVFNNPQLKIAQASNVAGQDICYCTIETAFVVGSLMLNPSATSVEMQAAGAQFEASIAHEAAQAGATALLMVVPDGMPHIEGEEFIRIIRRKITPAITQSLAGESTTLATRFLN